MNVFSEKEAPEGVGCGLLSAKGGLMMGTKKGGGFLQPAKESHPHYSTKKSNVKRLI